MSSAELSQIVNERLAAHARGRGSGLALVHKSGGRWRGFDWRAVSDEAGALAHGFAELGVRAGDEVLLLAGPRPRALLVALAVQGLGATPIAIGSDVTADDLAKLLAASPARFAFADEGANLERLLAGDARGALEAIVHDDRRGAHAAADPRLRTYARVAGDGARRRGEGAVLSVAAEAVPGGAPAGLWSGLADHPADASPRPGGAGERFIIVEQLASAPTAVILARWLASGALLALPEPNGDAERDRRDVAPTTLVASTAWLDRLWLDTEARLPPIGTLARRLVNRALAIGIEAPLARLSVLGPLARGLGLDRVRSTVVVGGTLAPAAWRLLAALGVLPRSPAPPATKNPLPSIEARTAA